MLDRALRLCCLGLGMLAGAARLHAEDELVKKLILPGESFLVDGRSAFILLPPEKKRQQPQPWIMYAPTLPAYPDSHEKWMHEQFLAAGVAVAGIDVGEAYGSPQGQKWMTALYKQLTQNRGFAAKPCLLGRSRGGLWVSNWAIANPERVAGIAAIYPVFDLRTYPGLVQAAPAYGLTPQDLEARLSDYNPIARIDVLAKAQVPAFIIHGNDDQVVPIKENSATFADRYQESGAGDFVTLIVAEGQGHNFWEGFFRCQKLVDFAVRQAKAGAASDTLGSTTSNSKQSSAATADVVKNLEYARIDGKSLLLDLYRPHDANGPLPVVIWIHGGGWKQGSKDRCPATWLVAHGYAVASINYRLTDEAHWPAQIDDCRAAVRWLREHAGTYGLDAGHFGVWGGSAGGHLAALLGTLDPPKNEEFSSRVQAVCDWYGPSDLLTMPPNVLSSGKTEQDLAQSNGAKLLGGTVKDRPELARQASAFFQVSQDDSPFLIMHGDQDASVPLEQSRRLHEKLRAAGVSSTLHVIPGAGHGGKEFQTPEVRRQIQAFFNQHLRPKN